MQYYQDLITEKSFQYLQELKRDFDFVLIGGWAVFLYSHSLKSKDIDIIVDYSELAKMKEKYDVQKNDRLKKYEIKTGEFDIDIYLPHYSDLGIEAEEAQKTSIIHEGFKVPSLEMLFLLKPKAWLGRQGSVKGQKDELDLLSMAVLPEFDWQKYLEMIKTFDFTVLHELFLEFIGKLTEAEELGLNEQKMSRAKKMIFEKIKIQLESKL